MKKQLAWFLSLGLSAILLTACGEEETTPKKETDQTETQEETKKDNPEDKSSYTADNAFSWLKDSGLISGEAEDVTEKFKGSEGLIKALKTDEADIMEFETEENAKKYHNPDLNSYAVKNIYILIKKGQDNAENFVKVLESGKPLTDLETSYSSEEQKAFVETHSKDTNLGNYADGFYAIPKEERGNTYDTYIYEKEVTWTGTVVDVDAISDSIVLYGKDDYNGEDWSTLSTEKDEMMPYTAVVELKDESSKQGIKQGDTITIKGIVGSRGDKDSQFNWKLYEGEIIK